MNQQTQNKQYICGCGKKYTSYPAYSTHRKTKHSNIDIQGSIIPKISNTKRGRPSYEFKKNQENQQIYQFYQGLTIIELGLLKLNMKFESKIIAESNQNSQYQLPKQLLNLAASEFKHTKGQDFQFNMNDFDKINKNHQTFVPKLMIMFIELMTTHMTQNTAEALIQFVAEFTQFLVKNIKKKDQKDQENDFDISSFNIYFSDPENKLFVNKLSERYSLRADYFVDICIILSQWLYKIGVCSKVIKIRTEKGN